MRFFNINININTYININKYNININKLRYIINELVKNYYIYYVLMDYIRLKTFLI